LACPLNGSPPSFLGSVELASKSSVTALRVDQDRVGGKTEERAAEDVILYDSLCHGRAIKVAR
jgi:hypothetical protein